MAERLRAIRGLVYPADPESLHLVRAAGGVSQLSADARARVRLKDVAAGDWCDDLPDESQAWCLAQGLVRRVPVDEE